MENARRTMKEPKAQGNRFQAMKILLSEFFAS
jgi:hypothetical protein